MCSVSNHVFTSFSGVMNFEVIRTLKPFMIKVTIILGVRPRCPISTRKKNCHRKAISFGRNPSVWRRLSVLQIPVQHLEDLVDILHAPTDSPRGSGEVSYSGLHKHWENPRTLMCLLLLDSPIVLLSFGGKSLPLGHIFSCDLMMHCREFYQFLIIQVVG